MKKLIVSHLACLVVFAISIQAKADLVIDSLTGSVFSEFDTVADSDSSTELTININSNVSANNSFTNSTADWSWSDSTLSGSSLVTAEKTVSARPGGDHLGSSSLTIQFTVNAEMDYSLGGTWGLLNASGTDDAIGFELTGPAGVVASDISTGTAGIASDSFAASGQLTTGAYTFTINSQLFETINNQGTAEAGWTLDFFTLTPVAVPEPTSALAGLSMLLVMLTRRNRD